MKWWFSNVFFTRSNWVFICLSLAWISRSSVAADAPIFVVLSANGGPYQEARQGFQSGFSRPIPSAVLTDGEPAIPAGTRIIVAIGGKAALYERYPPNALLIYCLAPGTQIQPNEHPAGVLQIHTSPGTFLAVSKFKELQPSLKRLAILWTGDTMKNYFVDKSKVQEQLGVEIISDRLRHAADLPDHLRMLKGKIDGIWLPPDATLITPESFATIKEFSLANGIPFYVPSEGLVEQGAMASVSASFLEIGQLAGKWARAALEGPLQVDRVFPENTHMAVSLTNAKNINLKIPPDVLKQIEKVFP